MDNSLQKTIRVFTAVAAALGLAVGAAAQATQTTQRVPGSAKVTTTS
jgi:hypothetical protein